LGKLFRALKAGSKKHIEWSQKGRNRAAFFWKRQKDLEGACGGHPDGKRKEGKKNLKKRGGGVGKKKDAAAFREKKKRRSRRPEYLGGAKRVWRAWG